MKHVTIGIVAHVDAGKTTLSEGFLYKSGSIKSLGRVDKGSTLFDSNSMERSRGITIFSKQAQFDYEGTNFTLIDTPGHADFSAEMERTLMVLDYAILVISAPSGVQSHTKTLWRLLRQYDIPTFIFVNKMDQVDYPPEEILGNLKTELSDSCIKFTNTLNDDTLEEVAVSANDETLLDNFMSEGTIPVETICGLIRKRKIFPCMFGSALKLDGIDEFLHNLSLYTLTYSYENSTSYNKDAQSRESEDTARAQMQHEDTTCNQVQHAFGARIYKITRDDKGNRLAHLKIMSGALHVKDSFAEDKVNQIRIYNGESYDVADSVTEGQVCTVTGLDSFYAGDTLGCLPKSAQSLIEPVISYGISFAENVNSRKLYPELKRLEEELPELKIEWNEDTESISIMLMGQVQIEILTTLIKERLGVVPIFDTGKISYKETICDSVIGVGHFEPLRHYAEVHLLIEPGEPGSGIEIAADCSEDVLSKNWQRLILTHIKERIHLGVSIGAPLTDVKITVVNGRAHTKHTEGGDFRQATYRAIRQGLMEAGTRILEPYYNFQLDIPDTMVGRAMTDMDNLAATINPPDIANGHAIITGFGPVATLRDYQINVSAYTSGAGNITTTFRGYGPCHNEEEVITSHPYDPENDLRNPTSSVFCAHGSGFLVPWDQVKAYMHVFDEEDSATAGSQDEKYQIRSRERFDYSIGTDEIDEILNKTFSANSKGDNFKSGYKKKHTDVSTASGYKSTSKNLINRANKPKLLVVDGYNVIFAWDELSVLAKDNIDAAKDKLISILSNYQSIVQYKILLVFDGYKVKGNLGSKFICENIEVVHTKENDTADHYIELYTHENIDDFNISVATSDGLIQTITRGNGCHIISSRELKSTIEEAFDKLRKDYNIKSAD